jgi:hypothetical protein
MPADKFSCLLAVRSVQYVIYKLRGMEGGIWMKILSSVVCQCGASLEEWEKSGWMREQDPYGWFQWYCR